MKISNYQYLGQEIDISNYFYEIGNLYFNAEDMIDYDRKNHKGKIRFKRNERKGRLAFNLYTCPFEESQSWSFPPAYEDTPVYEVKFSFAASNIFRIHTVYSYVENRKDASIILKNMGDFDQYDVVETENCVEMKTEDLQVILNKKPFRIIIKNKDGEILTQTIAQGDSNSLLNCNPIPFSYVRTAGNMNKYAAVTFRISPDEHFYGTGESFTKLVKTGQKIVLLIKDANGVQTQDMYKPIPFYMSSRGYGIFTHTSAPVTFDLGYSFQEAQTIFVGEEEMDIFIIAGTPKKILYSYTELTGRAEMLPLWTFGLWMSRITYNSEKQVREVAEKMKEYQVPCDVIHLDTGWFEEDWQCDYEFSHTRFDNPEKMIQNLKNDGYHICLWQLPYFTPKNRYYKEIVENGYAVAGQDRMLPTDDAILDFTNPKTVKWYQERIKQLLEKGVDAIKADFGEGAPIHGRYHNGKSGKTEHNLYPLRYNRAVSEVIKETTGNAIIWARSAWAGSQQYPLHWGGDCENTDMGMLSSLRGGLSLGMCGFTFWSHDAGGFVRKSKEELYRRWMFMSIFSSHIRCHGQPPKEPWYYSEEFLDCFRRQIQFRYQLLPYIYAQSLKSVEIGIPVMRSMFLEFPEDRNCYELETQYMFGEDILVAPMFEEGKNFRQVYVPAGTWVNLQDPAQKYAGGKWHQIEKGILEGVALVREESVIPMVKWAQNTEKIDWSTLKYFCFKEEPAKIRGTGLNFEKNCWFDISEKNLKEIPIKYWI